MRIYLDIETLPADWSDEQITAHARTCVPGTHKKPETIDAWVADNRLDVWRRTALDWRHSRICCVGAILDYGEHAVERVTTLTPGRTEADLLEDVHGWLLEQHTELVGHNVAHFDLPRLHVAGARSFPPLAALLTRLRGSRDRVVDTMRLAMGSERASLADLAVACGLAEVKSGHGSEVYHLWSSGQHDTLAAYCIQDVRVTRNLHLALIGEYA